MIDPDIRIKFEQQAEMLANRAKKRFKHLRKRFAKQNISVFRLYDWDIPEIRAVVDWYDGHLVIGEYMRRQSVPQWLPIMGEAVARALDVPPEHLHLKKRYAGKQDGKRYERIGYTDQKIVVSEREFEFYVNPGDYVDTGLFSDHRDTRQTVREMAQGRDFLNLYCYTATFSCYAAKGGARSTLSVDRSETAVKWARENMDLNGIPRQNNALIHADTFDFLRRARRREQRFDLAVVDPPSYSTTQSRNDAFDIVEDHPRLLADTLALMKKGGIIFFSTNHQDFYPRMEDLDIAGLEEITHSTIPEDYVRKTNRQPIHRCWRISV
ncbi:SAM-dependent methyltransferase [Desulfonema ishimotonii]|uniref:SAM-dependent methyltransferase n=1 Tax=Desulfonema ishimotonii TaxID=45657 RepID=A0A401FWH8_9BACT|nr:class I SAM-dependent methyltransferase [Desulfonema ishimotonii]GBC61325.1 SAM-dependent methyltransferase [Desulfonema ishimotonii]